MRQRRVVLQPTEDSCANVLGLNLPAEDALAATNRLTALARALKQAGDPRSLDQLRADTFLNLLLGNTCTRPHSTTAASTDGNAPHQQQLRADSGSGSPTGGLAGSGSTRPADRQLADGPNGDSRPAAARPAGVGNGDGPTGDGPPVRPTGSGRPVAARPTAARGSCSCSCGGSSRQRVAGSS